MISLPKKPQSFFFMIAFGVTIAPVFTLRADSPGSGVTHGFLATGGATYIRDGDGKVRWTYPQSTRDGWVLPDGNILLAVSKSKTFPGGGVVEVTPKGETVFEYQGSQSEVNTAQKLGNGHIMLSEAGDKPRLLEVDRQGKVVAEVPLKAQTRVTAMEAPRFSI